MQIILMRLYPFVYIDNVGNKIILYNMVLPFFYIFEIEGEITISNRSVLIMDFTSANAKTARDIEMHDLGIAKREESISECYLSDFSTEVYDGLNFLMGNYFYDAKKIVKRLFVSLSNSIDVFTGYVKDIQECKEVNFKDELKRHVFELTSLSHIIFIIDKFSFSLFEEFYKDFWYFYKIEVMIPLVDYLLVAEDLVNLGIHDIILLVYDWEDENLYNLSNLLLCDHVAQVNFYVSTEMNLKLLEKYDLLENNKIRIRFSPKSDLAELKKILSYNIDQLLSLHMSKNTCIRNEWINLNFWGDLYINESGSIFLNMQKTIGNIWEWHKIRFSELVSDDSLWRDTRQRKEKCKNCLFHNICPPISLLENMFNLTFCNIK